MAVAQLSIDDLREQGDVNGLLEVLKEGTNKQRAQAARALGKLADLEAVEGLSTALTDENMDVRVEVASALSKIGDQRAVPYLIAALEDVKEYPVFKEPLQVPCTSIDARGEAALALGKLGGPQAISALRRVPKVSTEKGVYRGLSVADAVEKAQQEAGARPKDRTQVAASSRAGVEAELPSSRRSWWERWRRTRTPNVEELIQEIETCRARGYVSRARKLAKKAVELEPRDGYAWMSLGMVLVECEDVTGATSAFRRAVAAKPELRGSEPGARLAVVYAHLGLRQELNEVLVALTRVGLGLDPAAEDSWQALVVAADRQDLRAAALEPVSSD
ncbi:MAG TPA: HEAT repeat domain-containing protein [Thermoanaerobaculia bacterium]|nr:HEAT repeat domain-containing protein [Thermoanaerobaculia bacterium]